MNVILGVISANVLINIISGITTTINGIYTIKDVINTTTTIGSKEVEQIMKEIYLLFVLIWFHFILINH